MDLKSTLYQKLSEQDKQNIKELTNIDLLAILEKIADSRE